MQCVCIRLERTTARVVSRHQCQAVADAPAAPAAVRARRDGRVRTAAAASEGDEERQHGARLAAARRLVERTW